MPPARENDYNSILNRSGLKKCGPTASKISKNRNFCSKFTHNGKCWGSTEKVEYRCTTTKLPVCNDTIIVLKITLLHSVSVITNFVIPKRDKKQRDRQKKALSNMHHLRGNKIPAGPLSNFFKIQNQENALTVGKCLHLGCLSPESDQTKNLKATYRRVQMLRIS